MVEHDFQEKFIGKLFEVWDKSDMHVAQLAFKIELMESEIAELQKRMEKLEKGEH